MTDVAAGAKRARKSITSLENTEEDVLMAIESIQVSLPSADRSNEFLDSLGESVKVYKKLTDKQFAALLRFYERR